MASQTKTRKEKPELRPLEENEKAMIPMQARNEKEAKAEAIVLSLQYPGQYVTVFTCFGLFADVAKRLHVFAPSDSFFKWYVLNGKVKPFSEAQIEEDWRQTPQMS